MIKVAMIGAGSVVFCRNLTGDLLSYPEFRRAKISYMDIDPERLNVGAALCRKVARALGAEPQIEATLDRRQALANADFVINMVQIGGFDSTLVDFEIPRKYGLNFTIADTTGPGGLFRALRTFPFLRDLCRDMEQLCPNAWLLNYSNPMSMNMQTVARTSGIKAVGLCHSVQGTFEQLMRYLGEDPATVDFTCAGINHMAFYLRLQKAGVDLYPKLFEAMCRPEVYNTNKVRFELMKRLGYFVTESSEHSAEYSPWFIPHGREFAVRYNVPIDEYLRRCDAIVDEFSRLKTFSQSDEPIHDVHRSHEYGSTIIHAMAANQPTLIYGNMPNRGAISNLASDAIAEAPTRVDRSGLHFQPVGDLPPQLLGYIQPHVIQHELFIRAALEGRRDHVYQACLLDPLTAATLTMDQTVEMCDELIAAHGDLLPPLNAPTLVPTSGKSFTQVDPKILRAQWDAAQTDAARDHLLDWHIIGPFPGDEPGKISLEQKTPIEKHAAIDVRLIHGERRWKKASACRQNGFVNLARELGKHEFCIAYAYTEIESIHPRDTLLRCGSDDGIRIWLNGKQIHSHEIGRGFKACSDEVAIHLNAGVNRLLVKIDNYHGGWGFGVSIPRATS